MNFYVGPDAALYVVDYYRARIEHPEWTSSDLQRDPRSTVRGPGPRSHLPRGPRSSIGTGRARPALGGASSEQLVGLLTDSNAWWRRTAQRLLVERADRSVAPALTRLATEAPTGPSRLHALWTLEGLGALSADTITRALGDADPGVRENAVLLAELNGSVPSLDERLAALASDRDPRVRFQVLATLGSRDTPVATAAHERLLFAELEDPWMQIAGLSAGSDRAARYFERATTGADRDHGP